MKKYFFLFVIFMGLILRIFYLNQKEHTKYLELLNQKRINYVVGSSAPRGRILDRNGIVLVDNIGVKTIYYQKLKGITLKDEIDIANKLASIIDIEINNNSLKKYWLITHDNGNSLITEEENKLWEMRKLSNDDIKSLKNERITEEMLNELTELEKKSATIYDLMNKGYSYDKKMIKKGMSDTQYSKIIDENIKGITVELTWDRIYNYEGVLDDILGRVGSIPKEEKEEYLKKGYNLNDIVGLSFLEKEYEDYLKGEKTLYKIKEDNTLEVLKEGKKGHDITLSIDIRVQLKLEELLRENILKAKRYKNTDYFTESYSIVGNPLTGEIIALAGQKLTGTINNPTFKNVNTNLFSSSYTVGSVVKMATISTGYKYGVIDIGTEMTDGCIKLYQVPIKCSYKSLGKVSDLTAISKSSNYYQFRIALGIAGASYYYNMKLNTEKEDFDKFRNTFKEYGLGNLTGIDLPNEKIGIIGSGTSSDLLLNLTIGQYDTYTPMELFQYVNTVASSGEKRKPQLMKYINNNDNIINNPYNVVGEVSLAPKYLARLKDAMHLATQSGTARNYILSKYNPAGKTGTSETFIDTNNDGVMDTKTTSMAFVGFAPYDNPLYSVIVLAPNIYVAKDYNYSKIYITRYISQGITNFLFENM